MALPRQSSISSNKLVSVALDFGTTYSGYAFSFTHDKEEIKTFCWKSGEFQYNKTPTSILFTPKQKFHAFGFDAEDMYADQSVTGVNEDWYLFRQFKLVLLCRNDLDECTSIEDITGKKMLAIEVFSAGIRFLKDHFLRQCNSLQIICSSDIQWVLTVPAILDDPAKQFMRLAANKAGIEDSDLTLILEPEAASVYYRNLMSAVCQKYIVLDCDGGTVSVTIHEETNGNIIKAIYRPTGGAWGEIKVDDAFQTFLFNRCGLQAIQELPRHDFLRMQRSFEAAKKKTIRATNDISVWLPFSLREAFTQPDEANPLQARIDGDNLRLSGSLMISFFQKTVQSIVKYIQSLRREPDADINTIYMVGGFSNCVLLREAIAESQPNLTIIAEDKECTSVVKGAVLFGHHPRILGRRKAAYSYGIAKLGTFVDGLHDVRYLHYADGVKKCKHLFDKITDVNEVIEIGKTVKHMEYLPIKDDQTTMCIRLFKSTRNEPLYTTASSCEEVGRFNLRIPDTNGGKDRKVKVSIEFGDTELKLVAVDPNSKIKYTGTFDFLTR